MERRGFGFGRDGDGITSTFGTKENRAGEIEGGRAGSPEYTLIITLE